ncbi:MAG: DUF368 domain-containing protein [Planctomycetaceae bacterium]|nr:DUF368 domain-containing protein [Planctomycetaceae bacterium]
MPISNPKQAIPVYLKGIAMGAADIVPGVSGGTIAFISGIYEELIDSIGAIGPKTLRILFKEGIAAAWRSFNGTFLLTLMLGILTSVFTLSTLISELLHSHPEKLWSFFFGLIVISAIHIGRQIRQWRASEVIAITLGTVMAYGITAIAPAQLPMTPLTVFVAGAIAICAMILPGISGSFILLILGKYHDITGIIKNAAHFEVNARDIGNLVVFGFGCLLGLLSFSKFLKWLLARHQSVTLATLTGFMLGSLCRIWPFQVDTTPEVTEFKDKVFRSLSLSEIPVDSQFLLIVVIAIASAAAVILLDRATSPHNSDEKPLVEEQ